jgi:hypothetical protein
MYLGKRKIRSAGRNSGSVELTLPALLQRLEGVECRLLVRDGPRPEIVLQPDFAAAQALLETLWRQLSVGLGEIDEIGEFNAADFTLALFPPRHWPEQPPLAYIDILALQRRAADRTYDALPEGWPRLLAALGVAAAYRLGLRPPLALAFGDVIAYLFTGVSADVGADFERGMAYQIVWSMPETARIANGVEDDDAWWQARPVLRAIYQQFRAWHEQPQVYAAAREQWRRALNVEMIVETRSFVG